MNHPNEEMANEEAAVNDTKMTRAVALSNGGSALGATIEAVPPPSATDRAIAMASTLLIAMSKRSLELADDRNEGDSYGSNLASDGKNPAPLKGMAKVKVDANSAMGAEVGQKPRGEQKAAMKDKKTANKI